MSKQLFKVIATRSEGWWALTFPGHKGWFSQGRDKAEVEYMAKDLIHFDLGLEIIDIELEIEYREESALAQ
jgi:predicted RNase H-like HicB family nuclease